MSVDEGEVAEAGPEGVEYGGVSSCMTVTCLLDDGKHVGGHLALMAPTGKLSSAEVLPKMVEQIGSRNVVKVHVAGQLGTWNSAYFKDPLYVNGAMNTAVYANQLPSDGAAAMAMFHLGVDADVPFSSEEREGGFTIKLEPPET